MDKEKKGKGLARVKAEGCPMHPDDCWPPLPDEETYQRQLKAYEDWLEETK